MHPSDFGSNRSRVPPPSVDRNSMVDVNRLSTWYEDLEEYEGNLEEMASATLDQTFQDEMQHVNQWFGYLSDPEKTATLYTLLQHSSQVQIRFFIHLLQEMRKPKPNPINRSSERASTLINLNRRPPPPPTSQQSNNRNMNNRHSFALGDTEQLSRMFSTMGTDWLSSSSNKDRPLQQPQPRTNLHSNRNSNLRPRSVMELGGTFDSSFSNPWLHQKLYNENIIERPRSADISSWQLPPTNTVTPPSSSASWKPLGSQHDVVDFQQHWKKEHQASTPPSIHRYSASIPETEDSQRTSIMSNHSSNGFNNNNNRNNNNGGFGHYLSPPKNFSSSRSSSTELNDGLHGYGSDHSDASSHSRYRTNNSNFMTPAAATTKPSPTPPPTTIYNENREDYVDMELLKDVTGWFRSLRLHKYNSVFEKMRWQDIIKLDDQDLQAKGVAALGARRKMLKVFENVREHCKANHIEYY